MEVNPRLWQWHGLAAACGVDLPADRVPRISRASAVSRSRRTGAGGAGRSRSCPARRLRHSGRRTSTPSLRPTIPSRRSCRSRACCGDEHADRRPRRAAPALLPARLARGARSARPLAPAPRARGSASGSGLPPRPRACCCRELSLRARSACADSPAPSSGAWEPCSSRPRRCSRSIRPSGWRSALLVVIAVVAVPFATRRSTEVSAWSLAVLVLGLVAGISLWWVSRYDGDAFFHLARVQKLLALDSLSLRSVDEFKRRRAAPGLRVPALARGGRADRAARGRRARPRPSCTLPTVLLPAVVRAHLRGGHEPLPLALVRRRRRARAVRADRPRAGTRRRVLVAGAPCDGLAGAACCRPCSRSSSPTSASRP